MKFRNLLQSSKCYFRICKPVCKQRLWLAPELNKLSLQTSLRILKWTFELSNEFPNFTTNFWKFRMLQSEKLSEIDINTIKVEQDGSPFFFFALISVLHIQY